jgi:hypothetical protein
VKRDTNMSWYVKEHDVLKMLCSMEKPLGLGMDQVTLNLRFVLTLDTDPPFVRLQLDGDSQRLVHLLEDAGFAVPQARKLLCGGGRQVSFERVLKCVSYFVTERLLDSLGGGGDQPGSEVSASGGTQKRIII